jgi:hypothetical protein
MPHYTGISYPIYLLVGLICSVVTKVRELTTPRRTPRRGHELSVIVLVPAFNEADVLGDTLASLHSQT